MHVNAAPCPLYCFVSALLIRDDHNIKGVSINNDQHKLSVYADDVLLDLSDSEISVPSLKRLICNYVHLSGYEVNLEK